MKKDKNKIKFDNPYKEKKIEILELNKLDTKDEKALIEKTLNEMYEDKVKVNKGMINKCIKVKMSKYDDYINLAHHLVVEKSGKELIFKFQKKASLLPLIFILGFAFLMFLIAATYSGLIYLEHAKLNKDIDGDGIADINIDLNGDGVADINIDTNNDNKPDLNIDYKGNKLATFNIDKDNDGKADFNLVNDATGDNKKTCTINCDVNGDGWPNQNYDINGDKKADLDIYNEKQDAITDKIDLDGDMVCDVMCDDDGDGKCDRNCITNSDDILGSGPSTETGDSGNNILAGSLVVQYSDSGEFYLDNLYPDDQGIEADYPKSTFSVTNQSDVPISYKVTMVVNKNTYTSENFMYKLTATNGGFEQDFTTAPWEDKLITSHVVIKPHETQNYTITFKLRGIGTEQNFDQGKQFKGYIMIGD